MKRLMIVLAVAVTGLGLVTNAAEKPDGRRELSSVAKMESRTKDPKRDPGIFGDYWWANRFLSRHQEIEKVKGRTVDVVMLGEMRDVETISTAITAAETGHLVLSSLHTLGAAKTIDRVIDAFPANQQNQIRAQLSMVLRAVVSQRLILTKDGTLYPVFEVMCVNPAIQNLIREGKTHQIDNAIFGGGADMLSMDTELARMLRDDKITKEQAALLAIHPETVERQARFMRG